VAPSTFSPVVTTCLGATSSDKLGSGEATPLATVAAMAAIAARVTANSPVLRNRLFLKVLSLSCPQAFVSTAPSRVCRRQPSLAPSPVLVNHSKSRRNPRDPLETVPFGRGTPEPSK